MPKKITPKICTPALTILDLWTKPTPTEQPITQRSIDFYPEMEEVNRSAAIV